MKQTDRDRIRELAKRWMDLAAQPVMDERKLLWRAVHDLKMVRPMILVETETVGHFVEPDELVCEDAFFRAVERNMLQTVRHAEEVGDDVVVEPYYRLGWRMTLPDFGVPVETKSTAMTTGEKSLGYSFNFPIKAPEDIRLLKKRTFGVDRQMTVTMKTWLDEAMGDLLPVRVGNYDPFSVDPGDEGWAGLFFFGLTWQIYRFVGNDGLLYWLYDAPAAIHSLMDYMLDDRTRLFDFMERQNLLAFNTDNQMGGPRSYGYTSDLPLPDSAASPTLKNLWGWAESQETTCISSDMFKEFFLPYLAKLSAKFGLIYYGCCEPVHDRLDLIMNAIPNLRSVSVSPWADFRMIGEKLGTGYVYSRKPAPNFLSGVNPDWRMAEQDMRKTRAATKNCNVELLFRDLYDVNGERGRLAEWVRMTRAVFGC